MTTLMTEPVVLRAADHRKMPWKNGLGVTTEIMVSPPRAELTDFDWRVSMATVTSDGAFSSFANMDRTLSVLGGDGLNLVVADAAPVKLTQLTPPHSFPADVPAQATLIGQPVVDLNVMTRRSVWEHSVSHLRDDALADDWLAQSEVSIWFCHRGEVSFEAGASFQVELQTGDAIFIQSSYQQPMKISKTAHAALILVELRRIGTQTSIPHA